ncbi:hypothetical protein DEIPH_ctg069orf0010 [Deinococcus phoenicis]|uniref:Uncharacterized protein n=1 Tax=Deinococcus phoenicis TaxID=1476583 RepID=A0A016QLY6_9DEIO|nr:hypothetical protein [Deinococcus phoenicis]EYB66809.1 hypothetical protein DEIPH_ctg069orf0010 [Deinococcus phoenicis]
MGQSSLIHGLVQFHIFAAGLLGTAAHATLAKLLYAGLWPRDTGNTPGQLQEAAKLMYYGGDLAELLLTVLVFWGWYVRRGRAQVRAGRRSQTIPSS